jgi:hypothetical protein
VPCHVVFDRRLADAEVRRNFVEAQEAGAKVSDQSRNAVAQTRAVLEDALVGIGHQEEATEMRTLDMARLKANTR